MNAGGGAPSWFAGGGACCRKPLLNGGGRLGGGLLLLMTTVGAMPRLTTDGGGMLGGGFMPGSRGGGGMLSWARVGCGGKICCGWLKPLKLLFGRALLMLVAGWMVGATERLLVRTSWRVSGNPVPTDVPMLLFLMCCRWLNPPTVGVVFMLCAACCWLARCGVALVDDGWDAFLDPG